MIARSLIVMAGLVLACPARAGVAPAGPPFLPEPLPTKVFPSRLWEGGGNVALRTLGPEAGLISDPREFARLWTAWRPGERVPWIDFASEVVVVVSATGQGTLTVEPKLDERGRLRFDVLETMLVLLEPQGRGEFRYTIAVFPRKEIGNGEGVANALFRRQR